MDSFRKLALVLIFFSTTFRFLYVCYGKDDTENCESIVSKWSSWSGELEVKADSNRLKKLLFFLHIPRTGGRAYCQCFLKKMYPRNMECPHSYDKLRFYPSQSSCRLLFNHDDYSLMSKFPAAETSIITILRDPVDRVFSTYGFSVEVAARFLVYRNLSSSIKMLSKLKQKKTVSTMDIWPWKYLVPWMRDDLFSRRHARENRHGFVNMNNSYNLEDELMPLHEFIEDSITKEIVHNGATFQVAGLTNNSYSPQSHEVRHCVHKYPTLGRFVLEVAKRRLDKMLYVGLTENHKQSGEMFASIIASQIINQLSSSHSDHSENNKLEGDIFPVTGSENGHHQNSTTMYHNSSLIPSNGTGSPKMENRMTVEALMDIYENCTRSLRESQARRRAISLKKISSTKFSKEDRLRVPELVIRRIESLNALDMELYMHAQELFAIQQHKLMQNGGKENEEVMMTWWNEWVMMTSYSMFHLLMLLFFTCAGSLFLLCVNCYNKTNALKLKI